MKLIDRYIYAVTERLPEDIREDVSRELRTNIEDMLPENPTKNDVVEVLEKLGNPWKLANEYNPTKKYLIGPGLYDKYFSVLKLVVGIVATVLVGITLLKWIITSPIDGNLSQNSVEFFVDMFATATQGALQSVFWVTLVFAIIERSGVDEGQIPFFNKKWSTDDLPNLPVSKKRIISRGETLFSMICTVIFTSLLYFQPQHIALFGMRENGIIKVTPLFMIERLHSYLTIILILASIELGIFIWKFISKNWSIPLAVVNAFHNTALCILIIVMLSDNSLFNIEFLQAIAGFTEMPISKLSTIWSANIWVIAFVFVAIFFWDSLSAFIKCRD